MSPPPFPPTLPDVSMDNYGLAITYSSKAKFCHPLSLCLNETAHTHNYFYNTFTHVNITVLQNKNVYI